MLLDNFRQALSQTVSEYELGEYNYDRTMEIVSGLSLNFRKQCTSETILPGTFNLLESTVTNWKSNEIDAETAFKRISAISRNGLLLDSEKAINAQEQKHIPYQFSKKSLPQKCPECLTEMCESIENSLYDVGGFPNVTLRQVKVSRCFECGQEMISIPWALSLRNALLAENPTNEKVEAIWDGREWQVMRLT